MKKPIIRLLTLLVLIYSVMLLWFFITSLPVWQVKEIVINGNNYISADIIKEKINLTPGASIFRLDYGKMYRDLKKLPWITEVKIKKQLPGTLVINLKVRKPCLKLVIGNREWVIDEKGEILNRDAMTIKDLPTYSVYGLTSISEISDVLKDLMPICDRIGLLFPAEAVKINYAKRNNILLTVSTKEANFLVKLGDASYPDNKIKALSHLLKVLEDKMAKIEYIDIRAYKTPAVKFR